MSASFRNSLKLDEATELGNHHALFALQSTRQRGPVALLVLSFQVIPDLAVGAVAIPAKVAVRDGVDGQVLKTAQQPVLLRHVDSFANYLEADKLLVRIEQIGALFTHRQRQYNRSSPKFV